MFDSRIIPRLFVKSRGEQTTKLSLMLTKAPRQCAVRLTGGCGSMSAEDSQGLYELFSQAMTGFDGALIFGGTRMVLRSDRDTIVPGITEIPSRLRQHCPNMVVLGIIPKTEDLLLDMDRGLIISSEPDRPYVTVVHPEQDVVLVVQTTPDDQEMWDAEYQESLRITEDLRRYANWDSVTVSYNGGSVTRREIIATAERGWPVVLIRGSGRVTDEFASDKEFLTLHRANVAVAEKDFADFRQKLSFFGAMPRERLALVSSRNA
jgi:hypothetical protein